MFRIKKIIKYLSKNNINNYNLLIDLPKDIIISSMIPILCILLYYHKDIYQYYLIEKNKPIKAKQDCDTIVQAIHKYNSLEGTIVKDKYFKEIKGKYITGLDTVKDPWGTRYMQNTNNHIVYSAGPDKIEGTNDDIIVNY